MKDPLGMSLLEAAQAIRSKQISSLELTRFALARAKALQLRLNAFVHIDEEEAIATARIRDTEIASGAWRGPLHGVPLAHKDMFNRKGCVSTCGSAIHADWVADRTATVLERLDAAGAIDLGTLNMTEFAYTPFGHNVFLGDAKNPWNTEFMTGGSSSGSGVAVGPRASYSQRWARTRAARYDFLPSSAAGSA